ncbi:MAG: hypothetical protein Tsb0014_11790 [Pleurocapsa sp.]
MPTSHPPKFVIKPKNKAIANPLEAAFLELMFTILIYLIKRHINDNACRSIFTLTIEAFEFYYTKINNLVCCPQVNRNLIS